MEPRLGVGACIVSDGRLLLRKFDREKFPRPCLNTVQQFPQQRCGDEVQWHVNSIRPRWGHVPGKYIIEIVTSVVNSNVGGSFRSRFKSPQLLIKTKALENRTLSAASRTGYDDIISAFNLR